MDWNLDWAPKRSGALSSDRSGETDRSANLGDEFESAFSLTRTDLANMVIIVSTGSKDQLVTVMTGETDWYWVEQNVAQDAQEAIVYADGMGETDQSANPGNEFESAFNLTRTDLANVVIIVSTGSKDQLVIVKARETDQAAGIATVEVSASSDLTFVLLRGMLYGPDKT